MENGSEMIRIGRILKTILRQATEGLKMQTFLRLLRFLDRGTIGDATAPLEDIVRDLEPAARALSRDGFSLEATTCSAQTLANREPKPRVKPKEATHRISYNETDMTLHRSKSTNRTKSINLTKTVIVDELVKFVS